MLKPVGSRCNLACQYCYYLGKDVVGHAFDRAVVGNASERCIPVAPASDRAVVGNASERCITVGHASERADSPSSASPRVLSDELLELFTRQYIEAQTTPDVLFTWHGGEPLLLPVTFYEKALALQRRYSGGHHIDNCLQTNGTLLTDEWCRFFKDHHFLIGISIDGPQWMHDHYRRTPSSHPSWARVMHGIELLDKHDVDWNAMATVNDVTAQHPMEFYRFFRDIGCRYLQFTPVVERTAHDSPTPFSVTPEAWGRFLCTVFDEWVEHDVGRLFVQTFDATLANWVGAPPGVCSLSPWCGHAAVMETDGSVFSCDHFVFPEYRIGNIRQQPLATLLYGPRQQTFGRQKTEALTRQCHECPWLFACHGECPRNRFAYDCYGNSGHNYLCQGYRQFFAHIAPDMDAMAAEVLAPR